jgi:hypothetical protein
MYSATMVSPTRRPFGLERVTLTRYVTSSVAYYCQHDTTLNNISDTDMRVDLRRHTGASPPPR